MHAQLATDAAPQGLLPPAPKASSLVGATQHAIPVRKASNARSETKQ